MLSVKISGKPACIKTGSSFEYVSENRLFSGSDDYSLTIVFPLAGCRENLAIFGNINRADVVASKTLFDCEIRCGAFVKSGSVTITEISDSEVKTQFLEGRSEQNFDKTFDKIKVNRIGGLYAPNSGPTSVSPDNAMNPATNDFRCVALPFYDSVGEKYRNKMVIADYSDETCPRKWDAETHSICFFPYLLHVLRGICEARNYTCDFSELEASDFKHLVICNPVPSSSSLVAGLPDWSLKEFFEKLEKFLGGEFDFDHRAQTAEFHFSKSIVDEKAVVALKEVVDEHVSDLRADAADCGYMAVKNLAYSSRDDEQWRFSDCEWAADLAKSVYDTFQEILADIAPFKSFAIYHGVGNYLDPVVNRFFYAKDLDTYFVLKVSYRNENEYLTQYHLQLLAVNDFGPRVYDEEAEDIELDFVPARVDYPFDGEDPCLICECNTPGESGSNPGEENYFNSGFKQTYSFNIISAGKKDSGFEYYDKVYLAYWDGKMMYPAQTPHPYVEEWEVKRDWTEWKPVPFSMRLNTRKAMESRRLPDVDPLQKVTFRFLSDNIPDARSVFHIRGRLYLCEKITATFTENGMSRLMKGDFYPVKA